MTVRSSRTSPRGSRFTGPTSSGSRTSPTSPSPTGFVYLAVILDAWSRRVVGYALDRKIDARLATDALKAAIELPAAHAGLRVPFGPRIAIRVRGRIARCLDEHGFVGSMSRRGNPYDNAKAESFMKTLKVEAVYRMDYETFDDVAADLPRLHRRGLQRQGACIPRSAISAPRGSKRSTAPAAVKRAA